MMGWQWHQLDHMQIICTSLQTDNHATSPLSFYRQDALPAAQPTNSVKALKARKKKNVKRKKLRGEGKIKMKMTTVDH